MHKRVGRGVSRNKGVNFELQKNSRQEKSRDEKQPTTGN